MSHDRLTAPPSAPGPGRHRLVVRLGLVAVVAVLGVGAVSSTSALSAGTPGSSGCPADWHCLDIGHPSPTGGQSVAPDGTWAVRGAGTDIWGASDSFHFAGQPLAGDGTVSAGVVSQADTDQNAKAGVMLRAGTGAPSAYYAVLITPGHGLVTQFRASTGTTATNAGGRPATAPLYLRAVRTGSTFSALTSGDGVTWTKVSGSTATVPGLTGTLQAGVAVTSHHHGTLGTAVFSPVRVGAGQGPDAPITAAGGRAILPAGAPAPGAASTAATTPTTSTTSATSAVPTTPATSVGASGPSAPPITPGGSGGPGGTGSAGPTPSAVVVCGTSLCVDGSPWSMYGSTIYNPGLTPYQSGIKDPAGTVALAQQAHLDTIRITDFLKVTGDPATDPYDPARWAYVDAMIAAAGAAGLHVDLGLSDYRAMLWNRCVDPYTADWSQFMAFVANRVNTVSHVVYKDDPTIAFVSVAGEPLPVGTHQYTAKTTGAACTMAYSTADLTGFYTSALTEWQQQGGTVLVNSGGLGYLNESTAGIDWHAIFSLPANAFCDIKTYGGMQAWAPTAAAYCQSIGKPVVVEEFGWPQGAGDAARAQLFTTMVGQLRALHVAGLAFWNLGYQVGPTSYEVSPSTPATFAAVVQNAP